MFTEKLFNLLKKNLEQYICHRISLNICHHWVKGYWIDSRMPTVYDVPPNVLIKRLSEHLHKVPQIKPPSWTLFVKTGSHTERPPLDKNWWYTRCAALLRKVYVKGPIGLSDLRSMYGGNTQVGSAGTHHRAAGGSAIRKALIQLEDAGFVLKKQGQGRFISSKGRSLLDKTSTEIFTEMIKANPAIERYVK